MVQKFFVCPNCGNIVALVHDGGAPVICCGEPMKELVQKSTDTGSEKHVPVVKCEENKVYVKIGSTNHPMESDHYIAWVYLQTTCGCQMKFLKPKDKPEVCFSICNNEKVDKVMAYCNLHGLWQLQPKCGKNK